ncbi:putative adenylate kinase [Cyclospora cayetanensis]|uniref:Adenylate kinase n=1 Tax=Cyclospora cayetanensis TaxID=88456 RepID=A0A1D3CZR4_9EIME|nr:putative adenylate kinase [Cyclospora cayetanensis]
MGVFAPESPAGNDRHGKGTVCQELQQKLAAAHVSTGDELRRITQVAEEAEKHACSAAAAATGSVAGFPIEVIQAVGQRMREGLLVEDALVAQVLQHRLSAAAREPLRQHQTEAVLPQVLLLDGFPRTAAQVSMLQQMGAWPEYLLPRLAGRLVDPSTGTIYGPHRPPPTTMSEELQAAKREDDSSHIFHRRILTYNDCLPSILEALKTGRPAPKVIEVDATRHIDDVTKDSLEALQSLLSDQGCGAHEASLRSPAAPSK